MTHYSEEALIDYAHGELPDAQDALVHAHLATCEACRTIFDEQAAVGDLLRATAIADELAFPSMIKANVWATIRDDRPSLADRLRTFFRPAIAVPLAGALVLVAVFGGPLVRGTLTAAPGVSAAYYLEEHAAEVQANPLADRVPTAMQPTGANAAHTSPPLIDAADAATQSGDIVVTND